MKSTRRQGWVRTLTSRRQTGGVKRRCPSRQSGCESSGAWIAPVNRMASHVLICCLISGDLNQLNGAKHSNPDQLNTYPNIKYKGERVPDHEITKRIINYIALGRRRCWQSVDI